MRFYHLYEEEKEEDQEQQQGLLFDDYNNDAGNHAKKRKNNNNNNNNNTEKIVYRYDWLIGDGDAQTIENKIIDFVIHKKDEEGLGANGIDNYINQLANFYWINGVKGIDWRLIRRYRPDHIKKTQDREYRTDEVIAIEEKLDVRGKVIIGIMRGSGVRIGAESSINVGDLIPIQTKYGKIYKIWVYRVTSAMYATACTPEADAKIDAYFDYRMRFGEACRQYGKTDHVHECPDGYSGEVIQKWYKADEPHLDPDAPLIREAFDRKDSLAVRYPKRIGDEQTGDVIRDAAIAAGIRRSTKANPSRDIR
jgi:hypothetical protein